MSTTQPSAQTRHTAAVAANNASNRLLKPGDLDTEANGVILLALAELMKILGPLLLALLQQLIVTPPEPTTTPKKAA